MRKITNIISMLSFGLLLLFASVAQAISDGSYQIEIVCFENIGSKEQESANYVGSIDSKRAIRLNADSEIVATVLSADRALNQDVKLIQQSPNHKFIFANGWKQDLREQMRSTPIYLIGGKDLNNKWEIEGVISVKPIKNLFHVNLDLIFRKKDGSSLKEFRLTQTARLKSKESYYFDNPVFGALVIVSPIN
jgi:hypothetical protein